MKKININVFDIETFGFDKLQAYCCCVLYNNNNLTFYGLKSIKNFLCYIFLNCKDNTIFFSHNLTFDGLLLINNLGDDIFLDKNGSLLKKGNLYAFCLIKNKKKIYFRCSAKIFPLSLKEIALKLNFDKKLQLEHDKINELNFENSIIKNNVIEYCKRDVQIVYNCLFAINNCIFNILPYWWIYSYSISGLALKIFSQNFNKNEKINLNLSAENDKLIREAYYGGRCEVFGNPNDDEYVFHYDFESMYTNMLQSSFPFGDFKIMNNETEIKKIGFYYVEVFSKNMDIPILPYRCNITKKLTFPNGRFKGLYWHEELLLFCKNGGEVKKIFWAAIFEQSDYIFKNFSDFCLKERKISEMHKIIWKLIPNNFIGRLGLKFENEKTIIINDKDYNPNDYDVISDKKINDQWIVRINLFQNEKKMENNVIYPAIITSKARILWWETVQNLQNHGGRILYCDTDSIFIAYKRNVIGENQNGFKWVDNKKDTIIDKACFATNKVYCLLIKNTSLIKIKGISKIDSESMSFEQFKNNFFYSKKIKFSTKFFNKKNLNIKIENIIKTINFKNYDKRVFSKNKKYTKPITINK